MARCDTYHRSTCRRCTTSDAQAAPDCCRLTHPFIASITRRAGHDPVRPAHRPAGAGEVVPRGQGAGVARARHPSGVRCQRLTGRDRPPRAASQFIQVIHRSQPEAQQHPSQLITAGRPRLRARPRCPALPSPARRGPAQMFAHASPVRISMHRLSYSLIVRPTWPCFRCDCAALSYIRKAGRKPACRISWLRAVHDRADGRTHIASSFGRPRPCNR